MDIFAYLIYYSLDCKLYKVYVYFVHVCLNEESNRFYEDSPGQQNHYGEYNCCCKEFPLLSPYNMHACVHEWWQELERSDDKYKYMILLSSEPEWKPPISSHHAITQVFFNCMFSFSYHYGFFVNCFLILSKVWAKEEKECICINYFVKGEKKKHSAQN